MRFRLFSFEIIYRQSFSQVLSHSKSIGVFPLKSEHSTLCISKVITAVFSKINVHSSDNHIYLTAVHSDYTNTISLMEKS